MWANEFCFVTLGDVCNTKRLLTRTVRNVKRAKHKNTRAIVAVRAIGESLYRGIASSLAESDTCVCADAKTCDGKQHAYVCALYCLMAYLA
jgi:hypothetical protein